ncbi:DUF1311 domain-containing protein [Lysobacter sp. TY2-98]|nr:DUF1311 domain-containing protein [Lysobacter sp. TY2-98]
MKRTIFFVGLALLAGCSAATPPTSQVTPAPAQSGPSHTAATPPTPPSSGETLGLRPDYQKCVDDAAGVVPDTQACIGREFTYQEQRLQSALDRKLATSDAAATRAAQATWRKATDARCSWNAAEEGQGQRLEANACELEAMAARADELSR